MERTVEISGDRLRPLFYALQLGIALVLLVVFAGALESPANVLLGGLVALLGVATVVALWRQRTGRDDGPYFGRPGDITHDPLAPGQAAKERWQKAVDRLPDGDDKGE